MLTKMETKGICLCKQETHIEDFSRTIVNKDSFRSYLKTNYKPVSENKQFNVL